MAITLQVYDPEGTARSKKRPGPSRSTPANSNESEWRSRGPTVWPQLCKLHRDASALRSMVMLAIHEHKQSTKTPPPAPRPKNPPQPPLLSMGKPTSPVRGELLILLSIGGILFSSGCRTRCNPRSECHL